MKYLSQFLIIMVIAFLGEIVHNLLPFPIPATVYGIVLMFAALFFKIIKVEQVKEVGGFLTSILPILFVSPMVGILEKWNLIRDELIVILLLVGISTIVTFAVSGIMTQAFLNGEEKK